MSNLNEVLPWEAIYRGDSEHGPDVSGWNIGEPQPEITALIEAGEFGNTVLDAGCGLAEVSLRLAELGHTVVGLDLSPTAIAYATKAAADQGLSERATYQVADISSFTGYDEQFDTILDSTLFHSMPVELRDGYLAAIRRAAKPGAKYFILTFDKSISDFIPKERLPEGATGPHGVDEPELREAVAKHWTIDEIRPAVLHSLAPEGHAIPEDRLDEKGRAKFAAWLLRAHKPA